MTTEFLQGLSNGDWLAWTIVWCVIIELTLVALLLTTAEKE